MTNKTAVVLLSGGLDSATSMAIAINEGYYVYALTFAYGQRHMREVSAAKMIAEHYKVQAHEIINLDLTKISASALTDSSQEIPINRQLNHSGTDIPTTYVPARNMILLSCAVAWAESIEAEAVFIGINAIDYSGYPDCRPEFIDAFQRAAELGTKAGLEGNRIEIKYPLIGMTKSEIITHGQTLGVPFKLTWSCYKGGALPCGKCDSCKLRLKGFHKAGLKDPFEYQNDSS
ncbi:7-cyano-7-deazaguanine synthase QueC [[Eubacterium] cellulosolvens]